MMKISPKFIDLLKRTSCALVATLVLALPCLGESEGKEDTREWKTSITESLQKNDESLEVTISDGSKEVVVEGDLNNPTEFKTSLEKALETMDSYKDIDENMTFVFATRWEKSENYQSGDNYSKGNREYKRTLYEFCPNANFNAEYFDGDYEKIGEFFRDNEKSKEIFDIIDSIDQTIVVTKEEEKNLDKNSGYLLVNGSRVVFKIKSRGQKYIERLGQILPIVISYACFTAFWTSNRKKRY